MVDKKYFAVKMLMSAIQYASIQLAELDDAFKQKLGGIDTIIQWKVAPSGPNSYMTIKNSKIEFKMDAIHDNPTYEIVLKNLDVALELFQAKIEAQKAIEEGQINVTGDLTMAIKQMFILQDLAGYLSDLVR